MKKKTIVVGMLMIFTTMMASVAATSNTLEPTGSEKVGNTGGPIPALVSNYGLIDIEMGIVCSNDPNFAANDEKFLKEEGFGED